MRNICDVIDEMIKEIPITETGLLQSLESVMSSIRYSPPENINLMWHKLHSVMPQDLNEEWEFRIASIFSTLSVEELKLRFNKK